MKATAITRLNKAGVCDSRHEQRVPLSPSIRRACHSLLRDQNQFSRSSEVEIISDVSYLLHQRVAHIAFAGAAGRKFVTLDNDRLVIAAVPGSVVDTIDTSDGRVLTGNVTLARLTWRIGHNRGEVEP